MRIVFWTWEDFLKVIIINSFICIHYNYPIIFVIVTKCTTKTKQNDLNLKHDWVLLKWLHNIKKITKTIAVVSVSVLLIERQHDNAECGHLFPLEV